MFVLEQCTQMTCCELTAEQTFDFIEEYEPIDVAMRTVSHIYLL